MNGKYHYYWRMGTLDGRLLYEHQTFRCMTRIYCRDHHGLVRGDLCPECERFMQYSARRLEKCPYGAAKPTCANCPIHCYKPTQRETARAIMRYAGPRMTWRHPIRAFRHLLDKRREVEHPLQLRARRNSVPSSAVGNQGIQARDTNQERPAASKP